MPNNNEKLNYLKRNYFRISTYTSAKTNYFGFYVD